MCEQIPVVTWPVQSNFDVSIIRDGIKYGLVDSEQQILVEPIFDVIFDFDLKYEIAIVGIGDRYGAINEKGELVIQLEYPSVSDLVLALKKIR